MQILDWPSAAVIIAAIAAIITALVKHAPPRTSADVAAIRELMEKQHELNRRRWRALFRRLTRLGKD